MATKKETNEKDTISVCGGLKLPIEKPPKKQTVKKPVKKSGK